MSRIGRTYEAIPAPSFGSVTESLNATGTWTGSNSNNGNVSVFSPGHATMNMDDTINAQGDLATFAGNFTGETLDAGRNTASFVLAVECSGPGVGVTVTPTISGVSLTPSSASFTEPGSDAVMTTTVFSKVGGGTLTKAQMSLLHASIQTYIEGGVTATVFINGVAAIVSYA